jgi:putative molybdopterin biosynthesis protein
MATNIDSRVERLRRERGFSQRTLAEAAAITRQAVGAIESGRMQPSVGIALRLARALSTSVEELFGSNDLPAPLHERTATATIGGRTVTHALDEEHLAIEPAASPLPTVFIGGCDLSVGLLSRHAMARSRDMRVLWLTMTNRAALSALAAGTVHAAVVHGAASADRSATAPNVVRFEVASTEAGWLFERGNKLQLRGASDLVRKKARVANRPPGAGARRLFDEQLRRANVDPARVAGYAREVPGQLDAGRAIAQGFADAAIGTASVARLFGLEFVPLRAERCTLLTRVTALRTPGMRTLLDALRSAPYRRDLEAFRSYDVGRTGERIE